MWWSRCAQKPMLEPQPTFWDTLLLAHSLVPLLDPAGSVRPAGADADADAQFYFELLQYPLYWYYIIPGSFLSSISIIEYHIIVLCINMELLMSHQEAVRPSGERPLVVYFIPRGVTSLV